VTPLDPEAPEYTLTPLETVDEATVAEAEDEPV